MTCFQIHKYFMQPYTYLIGWPEQNLWYYGVRFRKNCDPSDLWATYFTSSIYVARKREELGEPPVIQVRRVFDHRDDARHWEKRVLRRMHVRKDPRFLNKSDLIAPPSEKHPDHIAAIAAKNRGKKRTPEQKAKMGVVKGKRWKLSEATKQRQSIAKKGVPKPAGFSEAVSLRMTGRVHSDAEKRKRKASLTGLKKSPEHIKAVVEAKRKKALERALLTAS